MIICFILQCILIGWKLRGKSNILCFLESVEYDTTNYNFNSHFVSNWLGSSGAHIFNVGLFFLHMSCHTCGHVLKLMVLSDLGQILLYMCLLRPPNVLKFEGKYGQST